MSLEKFTALAETHAAIDYAKPKSVKEGNVAVDQMRSIVKQFNDDNRIEELMILIGHQAAGDWVAFSVVDLSNANADQREKCVNRIRSISSGSSTESLGAKHWLRERGYG